MEPRFAPWFVTVEPTSPRAKKSKPNPEDLLKFDPTEAIPIIYQDPGWAYYPSFVESMILNQATPLLSETMEPYSSKNPAIPRLPHPVERVEAATISTLDQERQC